MFSKHNIEELIAQSTPKKEQPKICKSTLDLQDYFIFYTTLYVFL